MDIISSTKINKFFTCPFSFYCEYIGKKQSIATPDSFSFGRMVHDIIPSYYSKITLMSGIEDVKTKVEESFVEGTDYRLQKRKQALRDCQNNFLKFEESRLKERRALPTFTEKRLTAKLFPDLPEVEGIIDAYWSDKGGLWVDWKTGKYEEMDESRLVQGKIYEMLLIANGYPVKKGVFVNLLRGVNLTLPRVTDAWVGNKIKDILSAIEKDRFKIHENPLCNGWCEYRLDCDLRENSLWGDFNLKYLQQKALLPL